MPVIITPLGSSGGQFGTYTPVASALVNFASVTPLSARYIKIGSVVFVGGTVNYQASGAGASQFELTLPIASPGLTSADLSGVLFFSDRSTMQYDGAIAGPTANRARFALNATSGAAAALRYQFAYSIIP